MDMVTIAQQLVIEGICTNTKAANTTAMYVHLWMQGQSFDLTKSQVQTHRARLNRIGIDIGRPCDLTRFSPVIVREIREVTRVSKLAYPDWYKRPNHLQQVAA